jgi:hypothetical protein
MLLPVDLLVVSEEEFAEQSQAPKAVEHATARESRVPDVADQRAAIGLLKEWNDEPTPGRLTSDKQSYRQPTEVMRASYLGSEKKHRSSRPFVYRTRFLSLLAESKHRRRHSLGLGKGQARSLRCAAIHS